MFPIFFLFVKLCAFVPSWQKLVPSEQKKRPV